jgi:CRP/FNR family transcriptional regulator, cyclic AMP receptor protein
VGEPFLQGLPTSERTMLEARARRRDHPRGSALFHRGDPPATVHVVLSGEVKLVAATSNGREVVLAVRGPGHLLGELSAIDGEPRSATAVALGPVEELVLGAEEFVAFLAEASGAMRAVLRMIAERLRESDRRHVEYVEHDALGRVAARLVQIADRDGKPGPDGIEVALAVSQEELAGWVGASREAVAKALATLRGLGWLSTGRRSVVLHDVEALRRRAAG